MSETDPQSPKVSRPSKHFSDAELMRYARQIILPGWDIEAQSKLAEASVLVIGAGGLGCPLALSLCRAGVGALTLIDIDVVELSNLQRQSLFTEAHLGKSKAQVAASELKKHNPHVVLKGVQDRVQNLTDEFLGRFDLIIDGSDNFATRDWLNSAAFDLSSPLLSAAAVGFDGQLAFYDFSRSDQACYRCVFGEGGVDTRCSELGVLTTTTQVMGALAANAALIWLGQGVNTLKNQLLLWSAKTLTSRKITYHRDPLCEVCGTPPEST